MENKKWVLNITHNDSDAVGCSLLLRDYYSNHVEEDVTLINVYNSISGLEKNISGILVALKNKKEYITEENETYKLEDLERIYITDLSYSNFPIPRIVDFATEVGSDANFDVIGIDHHKANIPDNITTWHLDTSVSATIGVKNYLEQEEGYVSDNEYLLRTVELINKYDTHTGNNDDEEAFVNRLCMLISPKETEEMLYHYFIETDDDFDITDVSDLVIKIYENNKRRLNNEVSHNMKIVIYDHLFAGIIMPSGNVEYNTLCDDLDRDYPTNKLDFVMVVFPTSRQVSFRTNKEYIDVHRYATALGGGGHVKAAGAVLSNKKMIKLIKAYYKGITMPEYIAGIKPHKLKLSKKKI